MKLAFSSTIAVVIWGFPLSLMRLSHFDEKCLKVHPIPKWDLGAFTSVQLVQTSSQGSETAVISHHHQPSVEL